MKLVVVTPVGPGHETIFERAAQSVQTAVEHSSPIFTDVEHFVVWDTKGEFGRSAARNRAILSSQDADWFFFLDADDIMRPCALEYCMLNSAATFGAVYQRGATIRENVWPCDWRSIVDYGARGTLSMGFFCRADVARRLRFNEDLDAGEDFEFYMRLPHFVKVRSPLVEIGRDTPSAVGPRGYISLDWIGVCNTVIEDAIRCDPDKFGIPLASAAS
jgi:glycosyltransferase involved in cell wall biosynthesis